MYFHRRCGTLFPLQAKEESRSLTRAHLSPFYYVCTLGPLQQGHFSAQFRCKRKKRFGLFRLLIVRPVRWLRYELCRRPVLRREAIYPPSLSDGYRIKNQQKQVGSKAQKSSISLYVPKYIRYLILTAGSAALPLY